MISLSSFWDLGILVLATTLLSTVVQVQTKRSRKLVDTCTPSDYHFDFTECDAMGGRWRVAIPSHGCEGTSSSIPPKRLNECFKSCEAGQFLNLTTVECEDCEIGKYSLGGGLRFDEWDPLPSGFKTQVEKFHSTFSAIGRQISGINCSKWGWRARGDVLLSQGGPCVATLLYSAQLVKPGSLKFTYQYVDDSVLFQFQANSDQCESIAEAEKSRWPPLTGDGVWRTEEIPLHSGLNIFQWKTMGIDSHDRPKPVLIKKIEIDGVGYTSSCNPCPEGSYSNTKASKNCIPCKANTYSGHKSTVCTPCSSDDEYSEAGSSSCSPKPACSATDYYQAHTPCDRNNQTRIVYKWIEPKICLETREGSEKLPLPGPPFPCPSCNPGTEYVAEGTCRYCPPNQYSDGTVPCTKCPKNTVPETGHRLVQWYTWPANIHTTCISPEDNGCNLAPPWQLTGKYVRSGKGHAEWVYLVMTLTVTGFRGRGGMVDGELLEVGRISFEFEMVCERSCEMLFMQGTSSKNASVIQRWIGKQPRQKITHAINRNDTYNFSWVFQKLSWDTTNTDSNAREDSMDQGLGKQSYSEEDNHVSIFQINVTNSIDGGATSCTACREGMIYSQDSIGGSSCVSCNRIEYPPHSATRNGSRLQNITEKDDESAECLPCPAGMVTVDPFSSNSSTCRPCGPALITLNGLTCTTDCMVHLGEHTYDLSLLKGYHTVRGSSLFTASGTQYYHVFNISFCADSNAQCFNNVSLQHGYGKQNSRIEALVCQSTVFPFPPAVGLYMDSESNPYGYLVEKKPISTHASSLGDHLVGISHSPSILNISVADDLLDHEKYPEQFHFFYSTPEQTIACSKGRSSTITFRCRMPSSSWTGLSSDLATEQNVIKTPDKCHDATCDGCNFHFIWETPFACHICKEDEVRIVRGECKEGSQEITYLTRNRQCLLKYNASWPSTQSCKNHLPFVVEIAIQFAAGLMSVLSVLLICFWRRHRKLEYKYMKLVASGSNSGSGNAGNSGDSSNLERDMLPVAESCALDPDEQEEDDEMDHLDPRLSSQMKEVGFYSENAIKNLVGKFSILNRIKTLTRKAENGLDIINLTDKEALS